jgi:predicted DNA-binding protein
MAKTPVFSFRLKQELQDQIKEISKAYGSPNPRAFVRELIETVLSGDIGRANAFNIRLIERATGQLQLRMEDEMQAALLKGLVSKQSKKRKTLKTLKARRTLKPHRTHERAT